MLGETEDGQDAPQPKNPLGQCTFGYPLLAWTNSPKVREQLHIPQKVQAWEMCSSKIGYTSQPEASQWVYEELGSKYRKLFYSGDTDGAVPTWGSQQWIKEIGWELVEPRRPYFVEGQVAGYVEER